MTVMTAPPPPPTTGDAATDEELALLRAASQQIAYHQAQVALLSRQRQTLVVRLRDRGLLFRVIAAAVPTTEQTIYKIHRDARRIEAHERGDHSLCAAGNCTVVAAEEAAAASAAEATLAADTGQEDQ